jgi:hypothetical protein
MVMIRSSQTRGHQAAVIPLMNPSLKIQARQIDPQRLFQSENNPGGMQYYDNMKVQLAHSINNTNKSILHMSNDLEGRII